MNEQRSIQKSALNRRAARDREALLSALELFVNTHDAADDLQRFRSQHSDFFTEDFYQQSLELADAGKGTFFHWYKRMLRKVWEGRDPENLRLGILLGTTQLDYGYGAAAVPAEFEEDWQDHLHIVGEDVGRRYSEHPAPIMSAGAQYFEFASEFAPDWRTGIVDFRYRTGFQSALYLLMRESWRAKVCPICRKYLIAAKPANLYCSLQCAGEAKRKRDLQYWRAEGSKLRTARKKPKKRK